MFRIASRATGAVFILALLASTPVEARFYGTPWHSAGRDGGRDAGRGREPERGFGRGREPVREFGRWPGQGPRSGPVRGHRVVWHGGGGRGGHGGESWHGGSWHGGHGGGWNHGKPEACIDAIEVLEDRQESLQDMVEWIRDELREPGLSLPERIRLQRELRSVTARQQLLFVAERQLRGGHLSARKCEQLAAWIEDVASIA